jgi:hypothetical protein
MAELDMLIEDDTAKIFEYVLDHGIEPEKQAQYIHGRLTAFYARAAALPDFSHDWGCGVALSVRTQLELTEGSEAYGHVIFWKGGPTMYDVGECRRTYAEKMNIGVILLECNPAGRIIDCRELNVNKRIFFE